MCYNDVDTHLLSSGEERRGEEEELSREHVPVLQRPVTHALHIFMRPAYWAEEVQVRSIALFLLAVVVLSSSLSVGPQCHCSPLISRAPMSLLSPYQ